MTISLQHEGAEAIMRVEGNIDTAAGTELSTRLTELMGIAGLRHVVFDLSTVNTVTSSAIGKLLNFFKYMNSVDGTMEIRGISKPLSNQFREIHLDRIFPISG